MPTKRTTLTVDGLRIEVARKAIKHLHLRIYPPDGCIRVSAPLRARDRDVRAFVRAKMPWIRRHLDRIEAQPQPVAFRYATGESHTYWGRTYRLRVVHRAGRPGIEVRAGRVLEMTVRRGATLAQREHLLIEWYRARLKDALPGLVAKWEAVVGVDVSEARVKRMKTRWGSCNPQARRIWVNLELARRPQHCLDYVIVHEMVHLLERRHNARFHGFMDRFMPGWRAVRAELRDASPGTSP
jgi:predicted metal-dependent hydrolase